jgi:hypothetical protein
VAAIAIPTRPQIHSWDTQHLEAAADHWQARAQNWEDAFTAVYQQVPAPGGVPWQGRAADAALLHVGTDRIQAVGAADTLYRAAAAAREGAFQIDGAKHTALQAIQAAEDHGFDVGEDLSIVDRSLQPSPILAAQRQAQAQAHFAAIRAAAMDLASTDGAVAGQVTTAAAGLKQAQFKDGVPSSPDDQNVGDPKHTPRRPSIQMVDNTTGPQPPTPTPGAQPQIGPFPVPPGIGGNAAPPEAPVPKDPTGGLLTPQNLPPEPPPPNIPGVKPAPLPGQPPMMGQPSNPALPSYPDLVNQVNSQGKIINDMQNAQHNVTPGGVLGSGLAGCASGAAVGALPTAVFPPADAVSIPGGCVVGAIGGLSSYLATIWGSNAFGGN